MILTHISAHPNNYSPHTQPGTQVTVGRCAAIAPNAANCTQIIHDRKQRPKRCLRASEHDHRSANKQNSDSDTTHTLATPGSQKHIPTKANATNKGRPQNRTRNRLRTTARAQPPAHKPRTAVRASHNIAQLPHAVSKKNSVTHTHEKHCEKYASVEHKN